MAVLGSRAAWGDGPRTVARCAARRGPLGSLRTQSFRQRRPGVRAVVIREFGPPEVLEPAEVAEVQAGPDEVVIEVEFANVTFVETQVRAGRPPHPSMLPALPAILGNGVGGTVGEASPWAGRRVVASLTGTGGYAERAASAVGRLIGIPDELTTRDAVALLADGRTALALAGRADLRAGETVLVEAAGGGVLGMATVQQRLTLEEFLELPEQEPALEYESGEVTQKVSPQGRHSVLQGELVQRVNTFGRPRKLALARDLGADVTVDYSHDDWERHVRDLAGEVDVVFDGVGGDIGLAAFGLLREGGRFCPFGMASGSFAPVTPELAQDRQVSVRAGAGGSPEELAELARTVLAEAAAGRLRPVVGQEFELAEAARAHAAIEARETVGKTLLTVPR